MKIFGFQWHLTNFCNLRCNHCYQDDFSKNIDLEFSTLCQIANTIFNYFDKRKLSINLTGGEPFLFPHLFDLINYIHSFSNLNEINIITNGTNPNKTKLLRLNDYKKIRHIKISLESGISEINDSIRGIGNFKKVISTIQYLKKYSQKDIVLMVTLAKYNYYSIKETIGFAQSIGIDGIIFERFVPIGNGAKLKSQVLTPSLWQQSVMFITESLNIEIDYSELAQFKAFWIYLKNLELRGALCNLGDESMALMPDGAVFPCRRLPIQVGNIQTDPFTEILSKLIEFTSKCNVEDCYRCNALDYSKLSNNNKR